MLLEHDACHNVASLAAEAEHLRWNRGVLDESPGEAFDQLVFGEVAAGDDEESVGLHEIRNALRVRRALLFRALHEAHRVVRSLVMADLEAAQRRDRIGRQQVRDFEFYVVVLIFSNLC